MKIVIDVSPILYGSGVSEYTRRLVEGLLKIDKQNEYLLYGGSFRAFGELKSKIAEFNTKSRVFPFPPLAADTLWNRLGLFPIELLVGKMDVYHSSDWSQAPSRAFKVTTVHDVWPLISPKDAPAKVVAVHRRRLRRVKDGVDRVIVPSEATKRELVKMGFDEKKVRVIYEAPTISKRKCTESEKKKVMERYQIKKKYLIGVGVGARKNTRRIVEACGQFKDYQLVIVGRDQEGEGVGEGVVFTGHVNDAHFDILLREASALVYPSLHEGFGLPILEAFDRGVPVVTSNLSAMAEVAGGAAELVDPESEASIVGGIEKVLKKPSEYVNKGRSRVKKFSWERAARKTLEVYRESREGK